jgi:hypothetical protein
VKTVVDTFANSKFHNSVLNSFRTLSNSSSQGERNAKVVLEEEKKLEKGWSGLVCQLQGKDYFYQKKESCVRVVVSYASSLAKK